MERTIKAEDLKSQLGGTVILDVRREADYVASPDNPSGRAWNDPEQIDAWIVAVPKGRDVVIYCVRGGSVSNSVVDQLQAVGVKACYIDGGIEAWKAAGGKVAAR